MGTILADFTHISGSDGALSASFGPDAFSLSEDFIAGGILGDRSAMLIFSIRSGDDGVAAQADVYINKYKVGEILAKSQGMFSTQTIIIAKASTAGFDGHDGQKNRLVIRNAPRGFAIKILSASFIRNPDGTCFRIRDSLARRCPDLDEHPDHAVISAPTHHKHATGTRYAHNEHAARDLS